jgi:hypothetical protein
MQFEFMQAPPLAVISNFLDDVEIRGLDFMKSNGAKRLPNSYLI